jgi:SNF2 family DNA or RNA helicase
VPRHAAPLLLDAAEELGITPPPGLNALRALAGDFDAIPRIALPSDVTATLRPYQQVGVDWIVWLRSIGMGGVLADDMGLGKTVQTLVALRVVGGRALVVAPTSVARNWAAEAQKFVPTLRVCVYHGPKRELDPRADLVITTYAILRLDLDRLKGVEWSTLVLDEAQAIKNPDSQVAQAARALPAAHRLAVTGTPVENRLEELWSAFQFVSPGLLGGRREFRDRFSNPIEAGDRRAQKALRRRIRPFVLRRLKGEVAKDLPPRTDVVLRCVLSPDERALYESVRALARADVAKLLEKNGMMQVLEILLRMRQAACHPGLLPGRTAATSAKLELLLDTLDEVLAEGHKALVFSQWTSMLDLVEPALRARRIAWARLDGSTVDRAGVVARFSAPEGPPVFLLSLKAGGTGLNLTAADYVFHLDPWWNPAVEDQATDRAHRIGQERPVVSCRLIAEDTVEERILALQEQKRGLARAALDEEALARGITRDELMALFD